MSSRRLEYTVDGALNKQRVFENETYGEAYGRRIGYENRNAAGTAVLSSCELHFDASGNIDYEVHCDASGSVTQRNEYVYED